MIPRLLLLILLFGFAAFSAQAKPIMAADSSTFSERVIGAPNALVTVTEYASLTCSHCADFHTSIFPALKTRYVDTGKVRWIMRDFPLDGVALRASALAHCLPESQYWPFIGVIFSNQKTLLSATDPVRNVQQYARLAGLSAEESEACLNNESNLNAFVTSRANAEALGVSSTPTFMMTSADGRQAKLIGARKEAEFVVNIENLLAKPKVK